MPTRLKITAQAVEVDNQGNETVKTSASLTKQFHPNTLIEVAVDMPTEDSAISLTER